MPAFIPQGLQNPSALGAVQQSNRAPLTTNVSPRPAALTPIPRLVITPPSTGDGGLASWSEYPRSPVCYLLRHRIWG